MKWLAPPDRRELTLILFSLTIFTLSYNLDSSLRLVGLDPVTTEGAVLRQFGWGRSNAIGNDGRKQASGRDQLENTIFGDWGWDEGQVAGDGVERSQRRGTGRHGAMWINYAEANGNGDKRLLNSQIGSQCATIDHGVRRWSENVPKTRVVKHVPGYTILDNVILFNGTVYIVNDTPDSLPPLPSIVASTGPGMNTWSVISPEQARADIGERGGLIRGVSWLAADPTPHNSTLFALWRMYTSLDPSIDSLGRTILPPPHRLILPHTRTFSDPDPPPEKHWIERARSDTGFHPYLLKAAFPHLTVMYQEDWEDYHLMQVPYVFERLVVADRAAAEDELQLGQPSYSPPFELEGSDYWWEPIRKTLSPYFDVNEPEGSGWGGWGRGKGNVVTYLHSQTLDASMRLDSEDHRRLIEALEKLGKSYGYEIHIISADDLQTDWSDRLKTIVRSTVVLGAHGGHLMDSVFMKRTPKSTLIELFPPEVFSRDQELSMNSLGINYIAWWKDRKFTSDDLPPVSQEDDNDDKLLNVDADALAKVVHEVLSKRS
ncbi:hypothetical protein AX16_008190 [Volvariella volvacea WC 439]|nr:hypothetical protein AX16_008190 [Volvariella volvacea WC 439]